MWEKLSCLGSALLLAVALPVPRAAAGVSEAEAQALRDRLTPMGAERAGNADGTIPAWSGGYVRSPNGDTGSRTDPFPDERPTLEITSANYERYADRLPEGQKALFQRYPDYRLLVYPTHRTAAAPQPVYDQTYLNATRARPAAGGIASGIENAAGGIPFPIPGNGTEAIWNHLLAFWGPAREDDVATYFVTADGNIELTNRYHETVDFPYYYPGAQPDSFGGYYFKRREISVAPTELAGRAYLQWQPLDGGEQDVSAWQYLPGQHRVRRSPLLAYDTPTPDGAGLESYDDYYIFDGSPDRYDFKLVGKGEMYIPYNNNRFYSRSAEVVLGPRHTVPDALRYELHRVWVVDATLVPGKRHLAPHRRFYLDEDTWFAVYADAWDEDGHLWKFSHGTMYLVPDLPAVVLGSEVIYDLQKGGYLLAFSFNGLPRQFVLTPPHPDTVFAPEALAAEAAR